MLTIPIFQELSELGVNLSKIEEIVAFIFRLIGLMVFPVAQYYLYRVRKWDNRDNKPGHLNDLLSPPPEITPIGRCNSLNNPILYVSDSPQALVSECRLKEGDIFAMAQFTRMKAVEEDLSCVFLGLNPFFLFEGEPGVRDLESYLNETFGISLPKYELIVENMHKLFVRESSEFYAFTSLLSEKYLSSAESVDAIIYPSIAAKGNATNYAIKPDRYRKSYQGKKVGLFEVLSNLEMRQIAGSDVIENGTLDWSSNSVINKPVPVGIRKVDPEDPRIYSAPWK